MLFQGTNIRNPSKASIALLLIGFAAIGAAFFMFLSLAEELAESEKFIIDQIVTDFISTFNTPALENIMGMVTETGSVPFLTGGTILLLIYLLFFSKKSKWIALFLVINMIGISALTKGLKLLFERQRPEVLEQYDGIGYSFPSGHSTGSIAFYGFIIYLVMISRLDKKWKWAINLLLSFWILAVASSRVFIGVHYFTDIIAGLALGLSWLMVCVGALELMLLRKRRSQKRLKSTTA